MTKEELLDLLQLAKDKNQKAQTKIINLFWIDVFSFVLKKIKDEVIADEITVNVFSKVLNKLDLYDDQYVFKTWILTIAQNTMIDYWRKTLKEVEDSTDCLDKLPNELAKSPEEILISDEEQQKFLNIVESMHSNYKEIIKLRFFEERSIKDISEILNLSTSNTKVRIMRAKKVLGKLLEDYNLHD